MKNHSASNGQFSRILFAVDGTPRSTGAVDAVATIARAARAEVHILHVWNMDIRINRGLWDVETLPEARQLVDGIAARLVAAGVTATSEVATAPDKKIPDMIADAARQRSAGLVAVGSRGRSDFEGLFLGSVGHRVLQKVSCPVLIIRQGTDQHHGLQLKRVLLAVAGGDEVPQAIEAVTTIALAAKAMAMVLHVRNLTAGEGVTWVESEEDADAVLNDIVGRLRTAGVTAEAKVAGPSSFVAQDIADVARTWGADLIVMGSRRLSELGGLVAGSVNHEVIHLTDRPVLVVEKG
jgi:nucleotide-binding universal stress UspA family protein